MKTVEQNLKCIADVVGADYNELCATYIYIKCVGSVKARDIRYFSERGIPIVTYLAKNHNLSNADYIKLMTTITNAEGEKIDMSFSESVGNLERAINALGAEWQLLGEVRFNVLKDKSK